MTGAAIRMTKRGVPDWLARVPLAPVAATAVAAASAFFFAAMPVGLLERIVVHSHLPRLLGAAAPPLGDTARMLLVAAAALGAGGATWAGFALLARRTPPQPRRARARAEAMAEAPALRRADTHPDAPPRRPIFAAADLGAPLDLAEPLELATRADAAGEASAPGWWPLARDEAVRAEEPTEAIWTPAPDEARPEPVSEPAPPAPNAATEAIASPSSADEPIATLLARLEAGLACRALAEAAPPMNPSASLDASLARALDDLQRMVARR